MNFISVSISRLFHRRDKNNESLREFGLVKAVCEIAGKRGRVPAGTVGTVLMVHGNGAAYEVEFDEPHAVLCAKRDELEAV